MSSLVTGAGPIGTIAATWDASVARAARVVPVGMGGDEHRLPLSHLQDREITVSGALRYADTWPTTVELAASGRVGLDAVVTGHQDLASAEAALTAARSDPKRRPESSSDPAVLLPWTDTVPAVLMGWFPGREFGNALADVLVGRAEHGGRLPTVGPAEEHAPIPNVRPIDGVLRYDESIHIGQRGYDRAGIAPRFPFGHGLGYTTWRYESVDDPLIDDRSVTLLVRLRDARRPIIRGKAIRSGRERVGILVTS